MWNRKTLAFMQNLIAASGDVNLQVGSRYGTRTILREAVIVGDVDIVKELLTAGASVDNPCDSASTLNIAVQNERLDLMALLLDAGADVNSPPLPKRGKTALQLAVEKTNL